MSKNIETGQRTHRQQNPPKIIVERHYVGTEKMETVFKRITEEQITKKVMEILLLYQILQVRERGLFVT